MGCLISPYLSPYLPELISFGVGTFSVPLETRVQREGKVSVHFSLSCSSFLSLAQTPSQLVPLSCPLGGSFFCYVNVASYHTLGPWPTKTSAAASMFYGLSNLLPQPLLLTSVGSLLSCTQGRASSQHCPSPGPSQKPSSQPCPCPRSLLSGQKVVAKTKDTLHFFPSPSPPS